MKKLFRATPSAVFAVALTAGLVSSPIISSATPAPAAAADNSDTTSNVQAKLNKSQFKDVKVSVDGGVATLSGTVDLYEYKADADKRVHKVKGVTAVRNDIQIAGPDVPDQELQAKLLERLTYDQVGYWNVFNAISVNVQSGIATLAGHALDYPARDSALALASTYPGVKDVVDDIQVDPPAPMDNGIRLAEYRAIYGYPSLNKYAIDPAKTIRISVQNGHVELDGVVDSKADRDTANLRANAVPGVFSVKNNLHVANETNETSKN